MSYDHWGTPVDVIEKVKDIFGGSIDLDAASNRTCQEYIQAKEYYGLDNDKDALTRTWNHNHIWLNPPYSAGNISRFVDKAIYEWDVRDFDQSVPSPKQMMILTNVQSDSKWFHILLNSCDTVLFWKGRIKFLKVIDGKAYEKWEGEKSKAEGKGKIGNSPRYVNSLFYFGNNSDRFREAFKDKGTFLQVKR